MAEDFTREWSTRASSFRNESFDILGIYEGSKTKVITLVQTQTALANISGYQHDLFDQAVRNVESYPETPSRILLNRQRSAPHNKENPCPST